jgi:hypothetical protein
MPPGTSEVLAKRVQIIDAEKRRALGLNHTQLLKSPSASYVQFILNPFNLLFGRSGRSIDVPFRPFASRFISRAAEFC